MKASHFTHAQRQLASARKRDQIHYREAFDHAPFILRGADDILPRTIQVPLGQGSGNGFILSYRQDQVTRVVRVALWGLTLPVVSMSPKGDRAVVLRY